MAPAAGDCDAWTAGLRDIAMEEAPDQVRSCPKSLNSVTLHARVSQSVMYL